VLAASQQEYLDTLKKNQKAADEPVEHPKCHEQQTESGRDKATERVDSTVLGEPSPSTEPSSRINDS